MTMAGRRPGAAIVAGMLVAGWAGSAWIRVWNGVEVEVAAELTAVALATAGLYVKMSGRPPSDGGPEGGAAA